MGFWTMCGPRIAAASFYYLLFQEPEPSGGRATGRIGHKQVHNVSVDALPKHKKKKFKKKKPVIVG